MSDVAIRYAEPDDAGVLADIYNHYIQTSTATFDEVPKTAEERVAWLAAHDEAHPVLIAVDGGEVLGWGSVSPYRERPAWRHTVEIGVYVRAGSTGRGVGAVLLGSLIEAAQAAGHHALIAQIVADNEPSLKLFERAGFEVAGRLHEVGHKFGGWIDIAILEKRLPFAEEQ